MRKVAIYSALLFSTAFCGLAQAQATTLTYGGKDYTLSSTSSCPSGSALRYQNQWWCPVTAPAQPANTLTYGGKNYTLSSTSSCPSGNALRYQNQWWCPVTAPTQPANTLTYGGKNYTLSSTSSCPSGSALRYQNQWWCPVAAATYTARLSWAIPSTRANGAPLLLSELAGYEIYYTSSLSGVSGVVTVNGASTVSHSLANLAAGSYYFTISAVDTKGLKSEMSNMASATFGN